MSVFLFLRHGRAGLRAARALGLLLLVATGPLQAADAQRLYTRALAATCAQCHGSDGLPVGGGVQPARLAGRPADELLQLLTAFRSGQRPATVMHQITKGYSPQQLEALAAYFSAVR